MTNTKEQTASEDDYIPFGPEWEKTLMRLPKKFIIELLRRSAQEVIALKEALETPKQ